MPRVNIPAEILELFVDSIPLESQEGRLALRSCLLASKSFFLSSRRRLFEHVEVHAEDPSKTAPLRKLFEGERDVEERITGYPSLMKCIKSLKVVWPPHALTLTGPQFQPDEDISVILFFLAKTQALQALDFYFTYTIDFPCLLAAVHIYDAIRQICSSPGFEHLTLQHLWDVHHDSFDLWKIKQVTLVNVTLLEDDENLRVTSNTDSKSKAKITPAQTTDPQLRVLFYHFRPLPSTLLVSPSPFSQLHTLTAKFDCFYGLNSVLKFQLCNSVKIAEISLLSGRNVCNLRT